MSSAAAGAVRSWTARQAGAVTGGEEAVVGRARGLFREALAVRPAESAANVRDRWLWGAAELVVYAQAAVGADTVGSWTPQELGDRVHELYLCVSRRTRFQALFRTVLDQEADWQRICRALVRIREQGAHSPPLGMTAGPAPAAATRRWWLTPQGLATTAASLSAVSTAVGYQLADTGRDRVRLLLYLAALWLACWAWSALGADLNQWEVAVGAPAPQAAAGEGSESESEASQQSGAIEVDAGAAETERLRKELEELRAAEAARARPPAESAGPSAAVTALADFEIGRAAGGPISGLGAELVLPAGAAPFVPGEAQPPQLQPPPPWPAPTAAPPEATAGGSSPAAYNPWAGTQRTQQQAASVLAALGTYEAGRVADPHWYSQFWGWLDRALALEAAKPDLDAALRRNGYWGAGTSGPVPVGLREELAQLKASTGDRTGASHMLAQMAPGQSSDVAPTWHVRDATEHPKQEWPRSDRVSKKSGRGRGRGRGQEGRGSQEGRGGQGGRGGRRGRGKGGGGKGAAAAAPS